MSEDSDLPEDVLAAIRAKQKIEAIKLLREHRNLGLKEAKQVVDATMNQHSAAEGRGPAQADSGLGRLILVGVIMGASYAAYRYLS